jgi:phage gpG-like protein
MISATVDASRVEAKFQRVDTQTRALLRGTIIALTKELAALVRAKLSGQVLNIRTGELLRSIKPELVENPTSIFGIVFSDPSSPAAKYASIHEYGGVIDHPGSSKFQAWQGANGWVYTHFTRPHKIPMPERSYMRSSLADMQAEIISRMTAAVQSGARAA